jgi:hypothetical protein
MHYEVEAPITVLERHKRVATVDEIDVDNFIPTVDELAVHVTPDET